jgi:hypothetical protein
MLRVFDNLLKRTRVLRHAELDIKLQIVAVVTPTPLTFLAKYLEVNLVYFSH